MDFTPGDEQRAIAELTAEILDREADPERVDDTGYDLQTWRALAKAGLLALALPAELGGAGLGLVEVGAVLTEAGRAGASLPALSTLALGLLPLNQLGRADQRAALLPEVAAGESLLTAALHEPSDPMTTTPRTTAVSDGRRWRLTGTKIGVPCAAASARILVPATTASGPVVFLVDPAALGVTVITTPSASGAPEHTVRLAEVAVDEADMLATANRGEALEVLHAYALAGALAFGEGVLAGALALTTKHLGTREQFGRPLAAFQAVAQQIADVYIAERTVHLAAMSAAWRIATGRDWQPDLDVGAYWLAEEAPRALATCHHLHGGIGVDVTYPLHRYYGLIKDLVRYVGGPAARLGLLGERVAGFSATGTGGDLGRTVSAVRRPAATGARSMLLELTAAQRQLRDELRRYFADLVAPDERAAMVRERHGPVFRDIVRRMGRDGWLGVGWPTEFGGRGFGEIEQHIFVDEAARADVQLPSVTLQTVGPTLQRFGTAEQKARFLPRILAGEVHFAIGYSEPDAGTDLAAIRTSAVRRDGEYIVNGQKIFTTGGHDADYIWLAVRTDPEAPRHKGISILIVDTRDPGYSWTPIITCDGAHHVNATYYSDVRVPADMLVGAENEGWKLITTQLNHERVMLGPAGRIGGLYDRVRAWAAARTTAEGTTLLGLPDVRAALAETFAVTRINELLNWQVAAAAAGAGSPASEIADASATKIFGSERIQRVSRILEEVVARHGDPADPDTAELARWLDTLAKRNLVLTFGGGVNEIQRELIATAGLELPRVPR